MYTSIHEHTRLKRFGLSQRLVFLFPFSSPTICSSFIIHHEYRTRYVRSLCVNTGAPPQGTLSSSFSIGYVCFRALRTTTIHARFFSDTNLIKFIRKKCPIYSWNSDFLVVVRFTYGPLQLSIVVEFSLQLKCVTSLLSDLTQRYKRALQMAHPPGAASQTLGFVRFNFYEKAPKN